jgi:hypothetical protein
MFDYKFLQQITVVLLPIVAGGIALWSWQRRYWEYQLSRQTHDWKYRQTYSRKESLRVEMETLLVDMNRELETMVSAASLMRSARQRKVPPKQMDQQAIQFNDAESIWLVQSKVLLGKINLYFDNSNANFSKKWDEIIERTYTFCELLNTEKLDELSKLSAMLCSQKDRLLKEMEDEINSFVSRELAA